MPHLLFLAICFVWGGSFILMHRALLAFGPVAIGAGRLLGGAAVLGLFCTRQRRWVPLTHHDWFHLTVVATFANALPYTVQPYAMRQAGEHAYFGLMITFVPIATILVSIPMLGKWPSRRQLIGVLGGLACAALIVVDGSHRGFSPWVLALALTVPVSYALGNTYIKWKLDHLPAAPMSALFLAIGGTGLAALHLVPGLLPSLQLNGPSAPQQWPLAIASLAVLGTVGTGAAILAFTHLIKTEGPLFASMVTYVVPMIALVWGQYDAEPLTTLQLTAVAGVLAMVALVQWRSAGR
jgi:drug/metabolite transporter (DMT)-like permease